MQTPVQLNIAVGQKALVTVDNWFYGPDGKQYRAIFGTVKAVRTAEESLGIRPNGKSANWYLEIGSVTIAGCQVHYALKTDICDFSPAADWSVHEGRPVEYVRPSAIFNADS